MKYNLIYTFILVPIFSLAQYSKYYQVDVNQNIRADVNINQTVSGEVTYKTIDYGELAKANALKEKIRLQNKIYDSEEERKRSLEIAQNPLKAYEYGTWKWQKVSKKQNGYGNRWVYYKLPHNALFKQSGFGIDNTSDDFVITRLSVDYPQSFSEKHFKKTMGKNLPLFVKKIVELKKPTTFCKLPFVKVGEKLDLNNDDVEEFFHKKEFSRSRIFGKTAYVASVFCEDDFEIFIKDYYMAISGGKIYTTTATFSGDKSLVNFEQLEGRRFYFKNLILELFSTVYESEKNPKAAAFWKAMVTPY